LSTELQKTRGLFMMLNTTDQKKPCNITCYTITFIMVKNKLDFRTNIRNNFNT